MKIKLIIGLVVFFLITLVYLERFFPSKKGKESTARRFLKSINDWALKGKDSSAEDRWTLKNTLITLLIFALFFSFILWDSFS